VKTLFTNVQNFQPDEPYLLVLALIIALMAAVHLFALKKLDFKIVKRIMIGRLIIEIIICTAIFFWFSA
jgi:hypothetical protein